MGTKRTRAIPTIVTMAMFYADQAGDGDAEFVIPEDLSSLSDADLSTLHELLLRSLLAKVLPSWYLHQNACKVFEQDMEIE